MKLGGLTTPFFYMIWYTQAVNIEICRKKGGFTLTTEKRKIPWETIKLEYITGDESYRELAEKYGCSFSRLSEIAREESWPEQRVKYRDTVVKKAVQKAVSKESRELAKGLLDAEEAADALLSIAKDIATTNPRQFYRHVVKVRRGNEDGFWEELDDRELETADTKRYRDLAAGLEIAARLSRTLKGILDEPVKQKLEIERERLNIERARAGVGDDDDDETGIVEIPAMVEVDPGEGIELGILDLDAPMGSGGKKDG